MTELQPRQQRSSVEGGFDSRLHPPGISARPDFSEALRRSVAERRVQKAGDLQVRRTDLEKNTAA